MHYATRSHPDARIIGSRVVAVPAPGFWCADRKYRRERSAACDRNAWAVRAAWEKLLLSQFVIARSPAERATKQSSWIATARVARLAMTGLKMSH
jgi:hypothetical protein